MAIILKTDKTYTPANPYGLDLSGSAYYGIIDQITYDKNERYCIFDLRIFTSQSARIQNKNALEIVPFQFVVDRFDTEIGKNGFTISQAYTKVLEVLIDWQSDEN